MGRRWRDPAAYIHLWAVLTVIGMDRDGLITHLFFDDVQAFPSVNLCIVVVSSSVFGGFSSQT